MLQLESFPGSIGDHPKPAPIVGASERADAAASPRRALIVEDEIFVAWHLEELLTELKIPVCGLAATAVDAVDKARRLLPDLILMDVKLTGEGDGVDAAREIRTFSDVAIVFVTAFNDATTRARINATAPGAPIVSKPASTNSLRAAISRQRNSS